MYSTCLFCHLDLGKNESIEHFPVGRRLAFDAEKGRLWVVCRRCTRWNLTPLEERWEAIEECERSFREAKIRVSTDNVGMARVGDGLRLIRIGRALRPEIVVWRYGAANQTRRRRSQLLTVVGGGAVVANYYYAGFVAGPLGVLAMVGMAHAIDEIGKRVRGRHRPLRIPHGDQTLIVRHKLAASARIVDSDRNGWALEVKHRQGTATISDETRLQRLAMIMASVNDDGVSKASVKQGERLLTDAGDADRLIARWALRKTPDGKTPRRVCPPDQSPYYYFQKSEAERRNDEAQWNWRGAAREIPPPPSSLAALGESVRAALEMAANEEAERRAMEGELAALEESWREAEEIAAIADNLLLPDSLTEQMERLRNQR